LKRRGLFWLLIALFAYMVVSNLGDLQRLGEVLVRGEWEWVLGALAAGVLYHVASAYLYYHALALVDAGGSFWDLLPVSFAALFVNVTVPTGGSSGVAVYADDAARRGKSATRATAGALLAHVMNYLSLAPLLVWGMAFLAQNGARSGYHTLTATIFYVVTVVQTAFLGLALWQPRLLGGLLQGVQRAVNGVARLVRVTPPFSESWAPEVATEFSDAARPMAAHPWGAVTVFAAALATHALNVVAMYTLFRAFYGPVDAATPVLAYVIAFLFRTITVTPQGVGLVEGAMTGTLVALGTPTAQATVIPFAFRGLSLWLPLSIGFVMLRRVGWFSAAERPRRGAWLVQFTATLVAAVAALLVVLAILPVAPASLVLLDRLIAGDSEWVARLATVFLAFALLVNVRGLTRRRRAAWEFTLILLLATMGTRLLQGLDYAVSSLTAGVIILLLFQRPRYYTRPPGIRIRHVAAAVAAAAGFTLLYGAVGLVLLADRYAEPLGPANALRAVLDALSPGAEGGPTPLDAYARYFILSIRAVAAGTALYALAVLLRALVARPPATVEEHRRAEQIVTVYGRWPLAHLALFADKAYAFSAGGSVTSYVSEGRVDLALEPIGPREDAAGAIRDFVRARRAHGRLPAYHLVRPETAPLCEAAGLHTLLIGYEGSVDLEAFATGRPEDAALRASMRRLAERGHTLWVYTPPLTNDVMDELQIVSGEWLDARRRAETRFSVGWFDEAYIRTCPVMVVRGADEQITAFANIVLAGEAGPATLDILRHRWDAAPGTVEYLLVAAFRWAMLQGSTRFSFGLLHPVGAAGSAGAPRTEAALRRLIGHQRRLHDYQGLRHLFLRFAPETSPRYLAYPDEEALPEVIEALVTADLGGPAWHQRLRRGARRLAGRVRAALRRGTA
jgi:phosphatidylglycerol lysyltransferase